MSEILSLLKSGFGFLTTIPVGITMEGIEKLMKHMYLFPLVGAVIGAILAAIGFAISSVFNPAVTSVALIASIYYLTGINHIDGLADFGDGIAKHGTREEKVHAMKDTSTGAGGLLLCLITVLGIFASLSSMGSVLPFSLIVAETSAKQCMVTVGAFGRKLHEGFGAMTVDNTKLSDFAIGMGFTAGVSYFALGIFGVEAFIVSQLAGLLILNTANRHLGGVSGDVIGASNEIGRLAALLFMGGLAWTRL